MKQVKIIINRWLSFLGIILSPGSAISFTIAVICLIFAISSKSSISNLLSLAASILTAIGGAFIKDDWDKTQGNSMLEKKGKSALRNLDAISQQVLQIRRWIRTFISKKETSKRELEEIDRHLDTMQMHLKSGLADWIDIVPELQKKEEVSNSYDDTIKAYIEERLENQKRLLTVGANKDLKEQLESRIKELEEKVKTLKKEQYSVISASDIGSASLSNIDIGAMGTGSLSLPKKKCSNCGKLYSEDFSSWLSPTLSGSLTVGRDLCKDCKLLSTS